MSSDDSNPNKESEALTNTNNIETHAGNERLKVDRVALTNPNAVNIFSSGFYQFFGFLFIIISLYFYSETYGWRDSALYSDAKTYTLGFAFFGFLFLYYSHQMSNKNTNSKTDRIENLGRLRDKGLLSEEEFQKEKDKILNS